MKLSPPKLNSVRVWLTLWNVAVLATVLVGFAIALRITIVNRIASRVNETTANIGHHIQKGFASGGIPSFGRPPREFRGGDRPPSLGGDRGPNPNSVFAQFRPSILGLNLKPFEPESHDRLWDPVGFASASGGTEKYTTIVYQHESVRIFSAPLRTNGKIVGVVQVARPLTDVLHTLTFVNYALKRLIPLALIAAGLGGALLTYRALRPVRQITQAAERIEAENLSGRLPTGGGDEFSELATTFNNVLDRLESAFRGLEQSHDQQRRFVGDASHELKTPLTAIKAHTSLAMASERSFEQYKRSIAAIDYAADRMSRIIQDLLILARADDDQYEIEQEPIAIAAVIEEAIEAVRRPDAAPIEFGMSADRLCVLGEPDSIMRLFVNLLSNAVRHTPPTGKISITAQPCGNQVRIAVKDTGEGIAAEHMPHLTKRFYRVDAARSRAHGGSGLGLAICETIIEAHNGTISIESTVDVGTTVTVTLPAADLPRLDSPEANRSTPPDLPRLDSPEANRSTPPDLPRLDSPEAHRSTPPDLPRLDSPEAHRSTPPEAGRG